MKNKHSRKKFRRGVLIALAATVCCVALVFGACKKSTDKEPDEPPAVGDCSGAHDFGAWSVETAATCTTDGEKFRRCKNCGSVQEEKIPATGHDYKEEAAVAATCHQPGMKAHLHCVNCGDDKLKGVSYTRKELLIPAAHRTVRIAEVAPACDKEGVAAHTYCYECGANFVGEKETSAAELVLPKSHKTEAVAEKAKTCTADGVKAHAHCISCGKNFIGGEEKSAEELKIAAGHDYGELIAGTTTQRAHYRCGECGKYFVKFSADGGYYETNTLSLHGDAYGTLTWHEEISATCTTDGVKGHFTCDGTEGWLDVNYAPVTDLTISAGHVYACAAQDGTYHVQKCARCGETAEGSERRHSFSGIHKTVDGGIYTAYECVDCGYDYYEYDGDAITDIFAEVPFIVGKYDKKDFYIGFTKQNGLGGRVIFLAVIADDWDAAYAEVVAANEYPAKRTVRMRYMDCVKDVEVTFDILRETAQPFFPVYQQGWINDLGDLGVIVRNNTVKSSGNFKPETIFNGLLKSADVTITDDGGFTPDADLSGGDKKYTVKFSLGSNATEYSVSFYYTARRTAVIIDSGTEYMTVQGEYPLIKVRYTDEYDGPGTSWVPLDLFDTADGAFDANRLGRQTTTVTLGAYAKAELNVYVGASDEVYDVNAARKGEYYVPDYYTEKGAAGVAVEITYFGGESGTMLLPAEMFETEDGGAPDLNAEGAYDVWFNVNGTEYRICVRVYDADDVKATEFDLDDLRDAEWLYTEKDGAYELKTDVSGRYFTARLSDGKQDFRVPVTAEMISYDKKLLAQAVAGGENVFTIKFGYKGLRKSVEIYIAPQRDAVEITEIFRDGRSADGVFVKDGALFGDYEILVTGASGGTYYETLKEEMIYVATFDSDGNMEEGSLKKADLRTAEKGAYRLVLRYDGHDFGDGYFRLFVISDDDLEYDFGVDYSAGRVQNAVHTGTKEEVLASLRHVEFLYTVRARIREGANTLSVRISEERLLLSDVTIENADEIDFAATGSVWLALEYKGHSLGYALTLLPDLNLYASREYTYAPANGTGLFILKLYENGFFERIAAGSAEQTIYGEYSAVDEADKVYRLDYELLAVSADGKSMFLWTGEEFGKRHNVVPETYDLYGVKVLLYLRNGAGYADFTESFNGQEYIGHTCEAKLLSGILELFGERYSVTEKNGVKTLELIVEGSTLYRYEATETSEEEGVQVRQSALINDNGLAYLRIEYRTLSADGTGYGEWMTDEAYSYAWRREGNIVTVDAGGGIRLLVNADGTLTALDELY